MLGVSGFFLTIMMAKHVPVFNKQTSPYYVEDPEIIAVVAALMCCLIGVSFTLVFNVVGDTILYCFATEQRRHARLDHRTYGLQNDETSQGYFSWLLGWTPFSPGSRRDTRVDYAP